MSKRRALTSSTRGSSGSNRDQDGSTFSSKRRRLDPLMLARGMSARWLGAVVHGKKTSISSSSSAPSTATFGLTPLTAEEMDRDLRHMEAYHNACTAYAQQFFIFNNRNLVQSGHYASNNGGTRGAAASATSAGGATTSAVSATAASIRPDFVMPVRIDPEEEKRLFVLRKRIAKSEGVREILETEYVSLRASYVYTSQALTKTRSTVHGQLTMLQQLVQNRAKVVALQRARVCMARNALSALQTRTALLEQGKSLPSASTMDGAATSSANSSTDQDGTKDDILQIWNTAEQELASAERACKSLKVPKEVTAAPASGSGKNCMVWEARKLPRTPYSLPIYLSQLSSVPDKGAAYGSGGVFGSKTSSMIWLQSNLPRTLSKMNREQDHVQHLQQTVDVLEAELERERKLNHDLQEQIAKRRTKNDEMCALATMLRSETEAVLSR